MINAIGAYNVNIKEGNIANTIRQIKASTQ